MDTLESSFIKEFKKNLRARSIRKDIFSVPIPDIGGTVTGCDVFVVKGLEDSSGLYQGLEGLVVEKPPKGVKVAKRKASIVTRDFVRDKNGDFIYENVSIPKGSMVIVSTKKLGLPYKYECEEKGFGYIDFVNIRGKTKYMYIVPKKHIYKANQTALALSVKNMKNYIGAGYVTWDYGVIYLHVIPYKPNSSYIGSKVLKTSISLDYSKEVQRIVDYWQQMGVLPNIKLCNTESEGNLVVKSTAVGYEDYSPVEDVSLGDIEIYGSNKQTNTREC